MTPRPMSATFPKDIPDDGVGAPSAGADPPLVSVESGVGGIPPPDGPLSAAAGAPLGGA